MPNFDELYPAEKIAAVKKNLTDFWNGKGKTVYSSYRTEPNYKQLPDKDETIAKAVQNILLSADLPGYNLPRFLPDFGTVSTASYWGGKIYTPEGGCIGIKPIIETDADVGKVRPGDAAAGHVKEGISRWREVAAKLATNRLYCTFIDIQGPLNTAALLWKQDEFLVAMYTNPQAVHELLEQITDQIIKIIKAFQQGTDGMAVGPLWPYIWLPANLGVGITEDYMPLLSPKLYREFGIPYVEKISETFGGLFIHCCGQYEHQLENLIKSRINLLGLEFHYPHTHPEVLFKAFGDSAVFVPGISPQGLTDFPDKMDYFAYLKEKRQSDTRLWFILNPEEASFKEQVKLVEGLM